MSDNREHRINYLDNLTCLLIMFMIFIHHQPSFCGCHSSFFGMIGRTLSFFMAWFFFKGGMMYRRQDIKSLVKSSAKRLLFPYLIFLLLGLLINLASYIHTYHTFPSALGFMESQIRSLISDSALYPTAVCWFLLSFFVVRVLYCWLEQKWKKPLLISLCSICLAYGIFLVSSKNQFSYDICVGGFSIGLKVPYYIGNMFHGLTLFALGHFLKEKQFFNLFFFVCGVVFVVKFFMPAAIDFRSNYSNETNYFLAVVYEISGCIVFNNLFKRFLDFKIPVISHIGRNSMTYYVMHYPVMVVITTFFIRLFDGLTGLQCYLLMSVLLGLVLIASDLIWGKVSAAKMRDKQTS